jgi:hypothetical protein
LFGSKSGERVSVQATIVEVETWKARSQSGGAISRPGLAVGQPKGPSERQMAHDAKATLARFQVLISHAGGGSEVRAKTRKFKGNRQHIMQINSAHGRAQT